MRSRLVATLIACVPGSRLRTAVYGLIPGYDIAPTARIGWFTTIAVDSLILESAARIGHAVRMTGPMRVVLEAGATMGSRNRIECGAWHADFGDVDPPYAREFVLGRNAMVTADHYFDGIGGIRIGEGSWIAGRGSQFWSHGLGVQDRTVSIGRYCYIGSAVRFAPGARLGDLMVVGIGSVVTGDFSGDSGSLVAGVPAAVLRRSYRPAGWAALEQALADGVIAYEESG